MRKTSTTRKCSNLSTHISFFAVRSLIVAFTVEELKEGEEFKVNWKEVEKAVRAAYPALKMTYARGDDHGGQLAISNLRLNTEVLD